MVAAVFKDLSLWNKTMLTNFEYEKPYFDCPPFLEINAAEAMEYIKTDSTFINQQKIKDSIFESSKILIDSIQENP